MKRPTEELLGPTADRALAAAESYLEYFLPDTKTNIVSALAGFALDRSNNPRD